MKRAIFAMLALVAVGSSSGCCCFEKIFCRPWGCQGGCGWDSCDSGCGGDCDGGCGGGGGCGCGGGGGGDYASAPADDGHGYSGGGFAGRGSSGCKSCAAHQPRPRNSGGQTDYAGGPPTGQVTYPYYTNRGPRDFLAKNPRSIGP